MKTSLKILIVLLVCIAIIIVGIGAGSVFVMPSETLSIIGGKLFNMGVKEEISDGTIAIIWDMRLPRVLLAFVVGAILAVSGTVMQSVLKNPLASSFTLGVSSGSALGAALVIAFGITIPWIANFSLPIVGIIFGMGTVFIAVIVAQKIDPRMTSHTIILTGMVFSLFVNGLLTLLTSIAGERLQYIVRWQMGSFSLKGWDIFWIVFPIAVIGILWLTYYHKEMDIMTFGETAASTMGVDQRRVKWTLLGVSSAITGVAVAFTGIIGFIDLIAPHIVRRFFGSNHRLVVPISALFGGAFMVLADLIARTIIAPSELAVGAITALIGAPFFAYIFFSKREK